MTGTPTGRAHSKTHLARQQPHPYTAADQRRRPYAPHSELHDRLACDKTLLTTPAPSEMTERNAVVTRFDVEIARCVGCETRVQGLTHGNDSRESCW